MELIERAADVGSDLVEVLARLVKEIRGLRRDLRCQGRRRLDRLVVRVKAEAEAKSKREPVGVASRIDIDKIAIPEAAKMLGVERRRVYREFIDSGKLRFWLNTRGAKRLSKSEILAYLGMEPEATLDPPPVLCPEVPNFELDPDLVEVRDAAEMVGISVGALRLRIKEGQFTVRRAPRSKVIYLSRAEVIKQFTPVEPPPPPPTPEEARREEARRMVNKLRLRELLDIPD